MRLTPRLDSLTSTLVRTYATTTNSKVLVICERSWLKNKNKLSAALFNSCLSILYSKLTKTLIDILSAATVLEEKKRKPKSRIRKQS